MKDNGGQARLDILKADAERHMLAPLRHHGWVVAVEPSTPCSDLLIMSARRAGNAHNFALIYSSATDNAVYKSLMQRVDQIYFRGGAYLLEQFARGVEPVPKPIEDFGGDVVKWNMESSTGKFSPVGDEDAHASARQPDYIRLLAELPIDAIWLRHRQLQSRSLAEKLVKRRADEDGISLTSEAIKSKAEGIAFTLRNADDYFSVADKKNISQRVLNLYYGAMAFASAEMLAAPNGARELSEIEHSTVLGHGLRTISTAGDGLGEIWVTAISQGFLAEWLRTLGIKPPPYPEKSPKKVDDLDQVDKDAKITIENLFQSVPELADLLIDIFPSAPRFAQIISDQESNFGVNRYSGSKSERAYMLLIDSSVKMTKEDIADFPGPISEIQPIPSEKYSGRTFRVAVDHGGQNPWAVLEAHTSPFTKPSLIKPVFGTITQFRIVCLILLYALSIVVRYRPSLWRRIQEGDLDQFRALIEAFLAVVERVLPQEFLEKITGQRVHANQPGSLYG